MVLSNHFVLRDPRESPIKQKYFKVDSPSYKSKSHASRVGLGGSAMRCGPRVQLFFGIYSIRKWPICLTKIEIRVQFFYKLSMIYKKNLKIILLKSLQFL